MSTMENLAIENIKLNKQLNERIKSLEELNKDYKGCLDELKKENKELKTNLYVAIETNLNLEKKFEGVSNCEKQIKELEEINKNLRKKLSEDTRALEEEHDYLFSRPTVLAAKLAELGFKGILTREQPLINTNVSEDEKVGVYTETLTI